MRVLCFVSQQQTLRVLLCRYVTHSSLMDNLVTVFPPQEAASRGVFAANHGLQRTCLLGGWLKLPTNMMPLRLLQDTLRGLKSCTLEMVTTVALGR